MKEQKAEKTVQCQEYPASQSRNHGICHRHSGYLNSDLQNHYCANEASAKTAELESWIYYDWGDRLRGRQLPARTKLTLAVENKI